MGQHTEWISLVHTIHFGSILSCYICVLYWKCFIHCKSCIIFWYCVCLTHKWVINAERHKAISDCRPLYLPKIWINCLNEICLGNAWTQWPVYSVSKPIGQFKRLSVEVQFSLCSHITSNHANPPPHQHRMPVWPNHLISSYVATTKYVSIFECTKCLSANIHKFSINAKDLWFPYSHRVIKSKSSPWILHIHLTLGSDFLHELTKFHWWFWICI